MGSPSRSGGCCSTSNLPPWEFIYAGSFLWRRRVNRWEFFLRRLENNEEIGEIFEIILDRFSLRNFEYHKF